MRATVAHRKHAPIAAPPQHQRNPQQHRRRQLALAQRIRAQRRIPVVVDQRRASAPESERQPLLWSRAAFRLTIALLLGPVPTTLNRTTVSSPASQPKRLISAAPQCSISDILCVDEHCNQLDPSRLRPHLIPCHPLNAICALAHCMQASITNTLIPQEQSFQGRRPHGWTAPGCSLCIASASQEPGICDHRRPHAGTGNLRQQHRLQLDQRHHAPSGSRRAQHR